MPASADRLEVGQDRPGRRGSYSGARGWLCCGKVWWWRGDARLSVGNSHDAEAAVILDSAGKEFGALRAVVDLTLSVQPVRSTDAGPPRRGQDYALRMLGRPAAAVERPGSLARPRC